MKPKVFISFDFDNDLSQKNLLVAQAKLQQTPFSISDYSIKQEIDSNWQKEAKHKISQCDFVIVLCGRNTHNARGVTDEIEITRSIGKKYYLLNAYGSGNVTKPKGISPFEQILDWNWDNLEEILA